MTELQISESPTSLRISPRMMLKTFSTKRFSGTVVRRIGALHVTVLGLCASLFLLLGELEAQVEPAQSTVIDSVSVVGNVRLPEETVLSFTSLQPGATISARDVQAAIKALTSTGRFRTVAAGTRDLEDGRVVLIFEVDEWPIVNRVSIRGLENVSQSDVEDESGIAVGEPYSPQKFQTALRFIRESLAEKSIPFAQIEETIDQVEGREKEIFITLDVTEGQRVTVAQVEFVGNDRISDGELIGAIGMKPEGFLWFQTGQFETSLLEEDLEVRLPEYYASRGHLDFGVISDTIIVDPSTGKGRLVIEVYEGPRYRVDGFEIDGNREFTEEELSQYYESKDSGVFAGEDDELPLFDRSTFMAAIDDVQQLYFDNGYIRARVDPVIDKHPAPDAEADPTVSVRWVINEFTPAYVSEIRIEGNEYTHDWVILERIFMLPGDVFSQSRLLQSYQAISALGYFEAPLPFPGIDETPAGDVIITFRVAEQSTGSLNFGTTVGGGTGLSGFIGYDQPNLFGQGKSGGIRWDFGEFQNSFTLTLTDPSIGRSRFGGSISLFNSRDRFFQFTTGERKQFGGSVRFSLPMPNSRFTRASIGYGVSRTTFRLRTGADDTSLFGRPPGTRSTVSVGITRTSLDNPLFPTTGSRQAFNVDLSGGPLGGDGRFVKYTADGSWWIPAGSFGAAGPGAPPSTRFAFGLSLRAGALFGNVSRFPFDRFWMGGVQFGEQLRGYDETSVTPLGFFPERSRDIRDIDRLGDAFLSMTAEYALRFGSSLSLSAFYDAGNIWAEPSDVDPTQLFRGAGFGIQAVTPFGPLGLDYAYGFDRPQPGWQFHFRLGPGF